MKVLVTGAGGFLGSYVVATALQRGHEVRALLRPVGDERKLPWHAEPAVEIVRGDLRSRHGLVEAVQGVDAVIHCAAAKSGSLYSQLGGTVVATENLLWALGEAGVSRLVLISSFAVYDYRRLWSHSRLDEMSPLEARPDDRDDYCKTKLLQERLVTDVPVDSLRWTVLRPGVIYGPDDYWTARSGMKLSERLWVRTGAWARLPLAWVENCAEAIVLAAETDATVGAILNVVDDVLPRQRRYLAELRARANPRPRVLPVSWTVMRFVARLAWLTNKLFFRGRAKVPSLLLPAAAHARLKPLRYTNERLRRLTGWTPRHAFPATLDRVPEWKPVDEPQLAKGGSR